MCQTPICAPEAKPNSLPPSLLAQIPPHPACDEALATASLHLPLSIFNHSARVFLYALTALQLPSPVSGVPAIEPHVLFVACILHDIGAASFLARVDKRFEVAGADHAAALLRKHAISDELIRETWLAIAAHSSPHIAEGAGGLVRLVRLAVKADFGTVAEALKPVLSEDFVRQMEEPLPRLGVEKELGEAVVGQAREVRTKAPGGSWPGDLLRAAEAEPEWVGVNKNF
ncbi:hypothetical protein N0V93_007736 [Gnomoniopsis smithogilvyi]|uniref:HD domain-containing protein n=1 Tax=Gnomoniopsis smithogilvyi TaxID=1191159 RepID=A0A9W8YNZ2_9PEZI|nr:hypothetical protein N0V93_007736 [Gnomoniopsis smithogilvyi]